MAADRALTVEGDRISRCEKFDEADLDAALARFDELSPDAGLTKSSIPGNRLWERGVIYVLVICTTLRRDLCR